MNPPRYLGGYHVVLRSPCFLDAEILFRQFPVVTPEWLVFEALLAVVAVVLLRSRAGFGVKCTTAATLLGAAILAACLWNAHGLERARSQEQLAHANPKQGRPGGYVSSDKCQSCHPSQYQTWHDSFHRTMTQVAGPESVVGNFNNVTLTLEGKSYVLQQRGSEYWVEMEDPAWHAVGPDGAPAHPWTSPAPRLWKRVGLLTGSHHMQVYWVQGSNGNMQIILPFAWLKEDQRWVPFHQTFLRDPAQPPTTHVWNVNCIKCHATGGQPEIDPQTHLVDTRAGELGIACEACHGPGEAHVAANQNPLRRYALHGKTDGDPTIINPKRLNARLSSEVCGQCHGIKWIRNNAEWQTIGFTFRPGDELDTSAPLMRPAKLNAQPFLQEALRRDPGFVDEHYWPDGMVRVSGRDFNGLVEAPCHQRGTLACTSCHSLHQSNPTNQLAPGMDTNEACFQCHADKRKNIPAHTHHLADSSGSLCYNCHMPHTVYGLLKGIRSHQIDSPNVATTLATGRPNACNLCHLDRSLGWTAAKLTEWYAQKPVTLSADQQTVSATVLNVLEGDAGQRALAAYSMGWLPARQASGQQWLVPYLAVLLQDPYSAVRYVAYHSLKSISAPGPVNYDFIAPEDDRKRAIDQILTAWRSAVPKPVDRHGPEVLLSADGAWDAPDVDQHRSRRNNRSMDLQE